jgi:signal peptidase II
MDIKIIRNILWLSLSLVFFLSDQYVKTWILSHVQSYELIPVNGYWNTTLVYNTGVAFGFLHHAGMWHTWVFSIFGMIMSVVFAIWLWRLPKACHVRAFALSCLLGGALSNLYDRLTLGYVVDFIDIHVGAWHWPVFNIADALICLGAFLLIIEHAYQD